MTNQENWTQLDNLATAQGKSWSAIVREMIERETVMLGNGQQSHQDQEGEHSMIVKEYDIGSEFSGNPKLMTWERVAAFSGGPFIRPEGWPKADIHTSPEVAASVGLPHTVVSGTQFLGHLATLMIDICGERWLHFGQFSDIKFVRPATTGDTLTAHAVLQGTGDEGTLFTVSVTNQDGEAVLVGEAAFLPST